MPKVRKVTLEILRHGPPHNQLLSPLTEYLALCGNHPSATVRVPYEHNQFLARHQSLNYEGEPTTGSEESRQRREMELKITAQEICEVLANVPGLIAELATCPDSDELTHFEIVLSASELALLPFELAEAPNGFPGAGQPLTLQTEAPLCLTRRVRRIDNERFPWPKRPKILFAAAMLPGLPVPLRSHLAALRQILDPWIRRGVGEERTVSSGKALSGLLKVLPRASASQIASELEDGDYTHLHVLAHGVEYKEGYDQRFGLALHDDRDPSRVDRVSSARLATAVRPYEDRNDRLARPAVVTLASCWGGGQGSVVGAGSSVAHALHEAGVPLVVSSQFPLSFGGSVLMAQHLYRGLLWGKDPRALINALRRHLKSQMPTTHDWASLVAYAALPADIERQLAELCYYQAKSAIEEAFYFVESDPEIWFAAGDQSMARKSRLKQAAKKAYQEMLRRLAYPKEKLEDLVEQDDVHRERHGHPLLKPELGGWVRGLLASTAKREAEVHWKMSGSGPDLWLGALREARDWYRRAFEADRTAVWALAQEVSLAIVLAIRRGEDEASWKEKLRRRWRATYGLLHRDLENGDRQESIWAHSNLIETHMLWLFVCHESDQPRKRPFRQVFKDVKERVLEHTSSLLDAVSEGDYEIRSRRRQSERFVSFFLEESPVVLDLEDLEDDITWPIPALVAGLAFEVRNRLRS